MAAARATESAAASAAAAADAAADACAAACAATSDAACAAAGAASQKQNSPEHRGGTDDCPYPPMPNQSHHAVPSWRHVLGGSKTDREWI